MTNEVSIPPFHTYTPDDVVRGITHLPSAPKVLPLLKDLLCDGTSATHEIVAFVRLDPSTAARVLQVANSAFYSKGERCVTVSEAVNRVGYDQIYELVSTAVASPVLARPLAVYGIEADELWKRSVACALGAEALAERTGRDRDLAYTIGLFHCVGMMAIDEWASQQSRAFFFKHAGYPAEATESERAQLGFTQAAAGGALLRGWGFSPAISDPVRWQYVPRGSTSQMPAATLLLASRWLRSAACAKSGAERPPLLEAAAVRGLGVSPAILNEMADAVAERLSVVTGMLDAGDVKAASRHCFPLE